MNRQDMIDAVAKKLGKSRSYATDVVDLFFSANGLIATELKIDPQASTALQELWIEAGVIEYDTVKPDSEIVDQSSIERVLAEI